MTTWAQLVYTSADFDDGSPGGWGVKLASPAETRNRADTMLDGVDTRAFSSEDLGDFPTAATLAGRNLQLTARRLDGQLLLLHAASAGADATGRPGNVVIHCAMSAEPGRTSIEHWRSESWLTPFGPSAVAAARLPEQVEPGAAVTRAGTAAFLAEPARLDVLAMILERIAHAEGPINPLVLLVDDSDEAAHWIAAITFLRDPRSDGEIGWTTWARAGALSTMVSAGVSILAVPRVEAEAARTWVRETAGAVLIDTSATYRVSESGEVWLAADGTAIAGADIPTACLQALRRGVEEFGLDLLRDVLEDIPLAVGDSRDDYEEPLWALMAVVLCDPDLQVPRREDLTWTVLMFGPRHIQPPVVTAVVDRWWQAQPEAAAAAAVSGRETVDAVQRIVLRRRVVLLLAGQLGWRVDLDGLTGLGAVDRALIDVEISNAVKRFEALRAIPSRFDEAAQILRVFACYDLGLDPAQVSAARDQLLRDAGPGDAQRLLELSTPDRIAPEYVEKKPVVDTDEAGGDSADGSRTAVSDVVSVPVPTRSAPAPSAPAPAVLAAPPTPVSAVPPAPVGLGLADPTVMRQSSLPVRRPVETRAKAVVDRSRSLSYRWVVFMNTARRSDSLDPEGWRDIAEDIHRIDQGDLADELLTLDDDALFPILREAMRVNLSDESVDTPFVIGRGKTLSSSFLYHATITALTGVLAGSGTGTRSWTVEQWNEMVDRAAEKRLGNRNPLRQAWHVALQEHERKGPGRA